MRLNARLLCVVAACGCAVSAQAAIVTFDLNTEFSGGVAPSGSGPWLRAEFKDVVGGVDLTLTGILSGAEFCRGWYFNLDTALDPTQLTFTHQSGGPVAPTIDTGLNAFKADGDGKYDIRFNFAASGPNRFNGSDQVVYRITSTQAITANSFDFLSQPDGGHGPFTTAAHVQATGSTGNDSGWITVPAPASIALFGSFGAMVARRRRA